MSEERKIVDYLLNVETGEITGAVYEGDVIIRAKEEEIKQIKNYNAEKRFIKLFDGTEELYSMLKNEAAFNTAIRLSKHVSYDDCVLRTNGHKNGKVLNIHDLSELMNIPYNTLRKHISLLYKNGILAVCKTGTKGNPGLIKDCIIANPDVFMRGVNVNETVITIFQEAGWKGYNTDTKEKS